MAQDAISFEHLPQAVSQLNSRFEELLQILTTNGALQPKQSTEILLQDNELLTRKQVKEKLKVSYPTLKAWTNEGKIQGYRIGTRVRYKAKDIYAALQAIKPATV